MNRKYVIIVHGLMIKNGTVEPYGTEVTEGVEIDDAERKVAEGYVLSKSDFEKKVKEDEKGVTNSKLSPGEKQKASAEAKVLKDENDKAFKASSELLDAYKKQFNTDAPEEATDQVITKALKDKLPIIIV